MSYRPMKLATWMKKFKCEPMEVIDGFPGYFIAADGRVLSCLPWRGTFGRTLAQGRNKDGYRTVQVSVPGSRRSVVLFVHKLVAKHFLPRRPSHRHQLRHLNGNKDDNRAANLAWGTAKQNAADRAKHGRTACGERQGAAKLTRKKVLQIRRMLKNKIPQYDIADRFGICQATVSEIHRGVTWGWLQ